MRKAPVTRTRLLFEGLDETSGMGHSRAPIFLIVDALDECLNSSALASPREEVLKLLEDLIDSQLPNLRVDPPASAGGLVDRSCNDILPYGSRSSSCGGYDGEKGDGPGIVVTTTGPW